MDDVPGAASASHEFKLKTHLHWYVFQDAHHTEHPSNLAAVEWKEGDRAAAAKPYEA